VSGRNDYVKLSAKDSVETSRDLPKRAAGFFLSHRQPDMSEVSFVEKESKVWESKIGGAR
jgi:hypothetical protein